MVHFVGAGTGAADLITVRGLRLIEKADVIIYTGSLINTELLNSAKESCKTHDSSRFTLDEVIKLMEEAEGKGLETVRLHTGEPSISGLSGNRWTGWMSSISHMIPVPESAPVSVRQRI